MARKACLFAMLFVCLINWLTKWNFFMLKGGRMDRSDKVSLWCVALLINTRFRFFILE